MRARDGVEEDLSAYAREDLVYKAKLAEQAERCARMNASNRSARVDKEWDGRRRRDDGRVSRRRWRATRGRDRTRTTARAREREDRGRRASRVESSRVESIRIDSIRSIDRTNDRTNGRADRTNERSMCDACAGGGRGRGWRTRDEGRIDASPRPRADRGRGARARARRRERTSESKRCEARGD